SPQTAPLFWTCRTGLLQWREIVVDMVALVSNTEEKDTCKNAKPCMGCMEWHFHYVSGAGGSTVLVLC
ncbi:hypothetical protein A2U01_0054997, partial [Trifolium medium]|nr:hypothetical protein [Trifolium medium]